MGVPHAVCMKQGPVAIALILMVSFGLTMLTILGRKTIGIVLLAIAGLLAAVLVKAS